MLLVALFYLWPKGIVIVALGGAVLAVAVLLIGYLFGPPRPR